MSLESTPPQKPISFCTPGWGGGHRKADEHQTSSQWLPSQRWGGGGEEEWGGGRGGGEKKEKWVDSQRCDERERGGRDASSGDINRHHYDINDIDDDNDNDDDDGDDDDDDDHGDNDSDEHDNDDKVPGASGTRQPGGITPAEREQYFLSSFYLHFFIIFYLHSFFIIFLFAFLF